MIRIEHSIVIARPLEEVFAFIANPTNDPTWNAPIVETRLTSEEPVGVGTTFLHLVQFMGRRFETPAEVTELVPNQKACVKTTGGPLRSTGCRIVAAVASGTRLTVTLEGETTGMLRLAEGMAARVAGRQLESDLACLKEILERQV